MSHPPIPPTPEAILEKCEAAGVWLRAEGERLLFRPAWAMTPELAELLREHRAALLDYLAAPPLTAEEVLTLARKCDAEVFLNRGRLWLRPLPGRAFYAAAPELLAALRLYRDRLILHLGAALFLRDSSKGETG